MKSLEKTPEEIEGTEKDPEEFKRFFCATFNAFFNRDPDQIAIDSYLERMSLGMSDREVIHELEASSEYQELCRHKPFVNPGHYYSSVANKDEAAAALAKVERDPAPESVPGIDIDQDALVTLWDDLLGHMKSMPFPEEKSDDFLYYFNNPNFTYGDGAIWHGMLRHFQPKRLVEVGSGFSSANLIDTNEKYFDGQIDLTFIEPYPDLLKSLLGDKSENTKIHAVGVQDADKSVFAQLEEGDVLFIDSTHVVRTGSDVTYELFEILPMLKKGVIVHFHDIFWPFEYPRFWAVDQNRSWNELYALRAFLTDNPNWEILMFGDYIAKTCTKHIEETLPRFATAAGGSIYLRKK